MNQFIFLLQDAGNGGDAGGEVTGPFGIPMTGIFMVGLLVVFYFFMIRPQQQQAKKEKQFRENLSKGDKVMTIGGIHGVVEKLEESTATLKIDENTRIVMEKSSLKAVPGVEEEKKK